MRCTARAAPERRTMTKNQLKKFCKKPIVSDPELIKKVIYEMANMPVSNLFNQNITVTYEGEKKTFSECSIKKISDHLLNSMNSERLLGYEALQKCTFTEMLSRISRIVLSDADEGWIFYLLSRLYLGSAVNMEKGCVMGVNTLKQRS